MKRTHIALLAATAMGIGTMTTIAADENANPQPQSPSAVNPDPANAGTAADTNKAGDKYVEGVRHILGQVTEEGVKGKVSAVADRFTANTQSQFKSTGKDEDLKEKAKEFADAWKAKYGHSFDLDRKTRDAVYSEQNFVITRGDTTNQARTASEQIGPNNTNNNNTSTSGNATGQNNQQSNNAQTAADRVQDNMATVTVPESHGLPAVTLMLANEGTILNKWRIQAPVGLDYQKLQTNLDQALTDLLAQKDQWPSDMNDGYAQVSHRILAAIANTGTQPGGQAQPNEQQNSQNK